MWTNLGDTWTLIWDKIVNFFPNILGATLILVIGWAVAILVEKLVDRLLRAVQLQTLFQLAKIEDLVKKAGSKLDTTGLISALFKWIIFLVAFIAAVNVLNLPTVTYFLEGVLGYLPQVIAAIAILLIGAVLAHFIANIIKGSIKAGGVGFAQTLSTIARYVILIFAVITALYQLNIAQGMLNTLFIGLVALLAIAGGLALGLGGQGVAKEYLEKLRKDLED
jgi:hypothetical protein